MSLISKIADRSNIDPKLIGAVIRQMGGAASFKESARDVVNGGIDGGFHGFIYHSDTVPFACRNSPLILNLAESMARDLGEPGPYSFIAGFNCLRDLKLNADSVASAIFDPEHEDHTQVMNALAWFATEEVCRAYADNE